MLCTARRVLLAGFAGGLVCLAALAASAVENETPPGGPTAAGVAAVPAVQVKKLFANNCSWCHGAYGMTADKGPRLAGTKMTEEQVVERIRHGKEGYMPAFGKALSDEEITAFAKYIKSLTPAD